MENELNNIFQFLRSNAGYNQAVRELEYQKAVAGCSGVSSKVIGLVYFVLGTRAFPNLENQMAFLQKLGNAYSLQTMEEFMAMLIEMEPRLQFTEVCNTHGAPARVNYKTLYLCLQEQKGWGDKTAALFCKIIYDIHANYPEMAFWPDAPIEIEDNDELYLPVDAVIKFIMRWLDNGQEWNFINTNDLIKSLWSKDDLLLWDDLWFWGFITQRGSGPTRQLAVNPGKIWSLQAIQKDEESLQALLERAEEFVQFLECVQPRLLYKENC
jgi:hypothetical protein